ncbi:hypothetical protein ACOME3_009578 [Neoechinorhynchus agilis]
MNVNNEGEATTKDRKSMGNLLRCPKVIISLYCLMHIICWATLVNLDFDLSLDAFTIGSTAKENMLLIDEIFGQSDDLNLLQGTKLRYGLEVIVKPKGNASLLSGESIRELRTIHQKIANSPIADNNGILVLDNVCVKQFGRCVIEGDYLFDEDFLSDVINTDLRYQASQIYSHARGGSGYGPYMLGKDIYTLYDTITELNALRFRYNLQSVRERGKLSEKWERGIIAQLLTWNHTFLDVSFGATSSLQDEFVKYFVMDVPLFAASFFGFIALSAIINSLFASLKMRNFVLALANIGSSLISIATTLGVLSMMGYQIVPIAIPCLLIQVVQSLLRWNLVTAELEYNHDRRSEVAGESVQAPHRMMSTISISSMIQITTFAVVGILTDSRFVQCSCLLLGRSSFSIAIALNVVHWYVIEAKLLCHYSSRLMFEQSIKTISASYWNMRLNMSRKSYRYVMYGIVTICTIMTIVLIGVVIWAMTLYRIGFKRSELIPAKDSYYHTFLKDFEDEFISGAPIMMIIKEPKMNNHTLIKQYFTMALSQCQKLPSTSSRFQVQWPTLVGDIKDLTGLLTGESTGLGLIKNDIKVERSAKGTPVIVKQSRAYCTYRTMDFSLSEIATMHGTYQIAEDLSKQFESLSLDTRDFISWFRLKDKISNISIQYCFFNIGVDHIRPLGFRINFTDFRRCSRHNCRCESMQFIYFNKANI